MEASEYKALRESIGSQTEVAKLLGVSRPTVQKRENGSVKEIPPEAEFAIRFLGMGKARVEVVPVARISEEIREIMDSWLEKVPTGAPTGADVPPAPSEPAPISDPWKVLEFDEPALTYKEVNNRTKELLVKYPPDTGKGQRINAARTQIYNEHFSNDDDD